MNKTISVYFSGTGFSIDDQRFLASRLHTRTEESDSQIKMGFNGCGVDYGFSGGIFGSGLDKQCETVLARVIQEIKAGQHITLNVYGHSRGGIAALLLAQQLGNIDKEQLTINLALLDPVPGNLITSSNIDPFKISLANKTMDLSDCKPLKKVLALYPHIPLPAIACHAPLFASYPKETEVDEEVINGCHAQAEQIFHPSSRLAMLRVEEFLIKNGTQLQTNRNYHDAEAMKQIYLEQYQQELACVDQTFSRETHSAQGIIISAEPGAKYFNNRHKTLADDHSPETLALNIQLKQGIFARCKQFFTQHPLIAQAIKWPLIALSVTSLLYVTGALAAIPLLATSVSKLAVLSIPSFAPIIGGALATLWYAAAKPILSWSANAFFYPDYAMRQIVAAEVQTQDSTRTLIDAPGVNHAQADALTLDLAPYHGPSPLHAARRLVEATQHDHGETNTLSF